MQIYTGRVVRRFSVYSHFYFIELRIPGENDQSTSSFPVIIKLGDLESGSTDHVRVGDVIQVTGQMETSRGYYNNTCFGARKIELIEKWDNDRYGPFGYIPPWNPAAAHSRNVPSVTRDLVAAIQCQVDVVNRVVDYLGEKFSKFSIEQSLSPLSVCQDRLIGIWLDRHTGETDTLALKEILDDRILTYTISRVYWLDRPNKVAASLDTLTDLVSEELRQLPHTNPISIRVHAFPKHIPIEKMAQNILSRNPSITFDPRKFTHTLSIVFVNGLWYASVARADSVTGVGSHIYKGGSLASLEVSKASQKLYEAFTRIDRIWGKSLFTDLTGKIAIDVGASPGGWSYCMALDMNAKKVIAVDNGLLAPPTPAPVEHWKMKGEEAVKKLLKDSENIGTISCYTCDMNAECTVTVDLFLRAVPLMARNSVAILTFKRTIKNKEKWELLKSREMGKLKEKFANIVEIHLIANTPNETTVLVRVD